MTEEIDQPSAKLALTVPEQETAETPATTLGTNDTADQSFRSTAEPAANVTAEHSVTLNSDLSQLQPNLGLDCVVAIAPVRSDLVPPNS